MDVFYEESASCSNEIKEEKRYKIINAVSSITGVISILGLVLFLYFLILSIGIRPSTAEQKESYEAILSYGAVALIITAVLGGISLLCRFYKRRLNVSYDYTFVSGELRISKVFNLTRRKLIAKIQAEDILQIGDADSSSYELLKSNPTTEQVFCSSNEMVADGKFFMYVYVAQLDGRKLFVLECRETLLIHILKFVKRGTLDAEYVAQDKKIAR